MLQETSFSDSLCALCANKHESRREGYFAINKYVIMVDFCVRICDL